MENVTCCSCGILFAVPTDWIDARRADKASFYCPNGHSLSYQVSTLEKVKQEKERVEREMQSKLNEANHALLVVQKECESERRKRRKIEARISKGVCPCCNRTFSNIQQHMSTKHKEYALPPGQAKQIQGTVQ